MTNKGMVKSAGGIWFKTGKKESGYGILPRNSKRLIDAACDLALIKRGVDPNPGRWRPKEV